MSDQPINPGHTYGSVRLLRIFGILLFALTGPARIFAESDRAIDLHDAMALNKTRLLQELNSLPDRSYTHICCPAPKVSNDLEASFYDLKQSREERSILMDQERYYRSIKRFLDSGWDKRMLDPYFRSMIKLYASSICIPSAESDKGPSAFGVDDRVRPGYWVCHYQGNFTAPETARYRFCGMGDDILFVRVNRKLVLDACWKQHRGKMSDWNSKDKNNRKFSLDHGMMVIGDWVELKQGEPAELEVLVGEISGGSFCAMLLIEQEGGEYRRVQTINGIRPVLPVFRTGELSEELIQQLKLNPEEVTLEGRSFRNYENP